jgi:hypothetical protein
MRFGRDADTGILVQPYFLMRSYFVPKVLSGNPSIAARALIDLSVRPNSFEIALSEAPIRTLFLSTASSAGLQGFPLLDTIDSTQDKIQGISWTDGALAFSIV